MNTLKITFALALTVLASSCTKTDADVINTSGESRMGTTTGNDTLNDSNMNNRPRTHEEMLKNRRPTSLGSPTPTDREMPLTPLSKPYPN